MRDVDGELMWESYTNSLNENIPNPTFAADNINWERIDTQEFHNMSPEQLQSGIDTLADADFSYQQHNFAFTDPEQRAKLDNVRGRLSMLRDLAKTPEQRDQEQAAADAEKAAEADRRSKMYPHTDGKRPSMGEVQAKKKEFRANGTFEKLGEQLPQDSKARASNNTFGAARSQGDGDIIGSLQSSIVMHWFRYGELPDVRDM